MSDRYKSDKELANAVCAGNREAFDLFFKEFFPRLYRFALGRLSGELDLAKDMVQQTMIKAVQALPKYRGEAALFTWLCQLCRSQISAHRRKAQRRGRVVLPMDRVPNLDVEAIADDVSLQPERQQTRSEKLATIHRLLDELPANYSEVLELKYIEELSVDTIAERLGTGVTAVQSTLARARRAFRTAAEAAGVSIDE